MTKSFSSRDYKRKIKRRRSFFTLLFFVILISGSTFFAINIADIFSSLLSNRASLLYSNNIRASNCVMYGICMGQYRDKAEAEALAVTIKNQGGAGYINRAGDYFVYAALYDSFNDAASVRDRLVADKLAVKIVNINVPAINFSYNGNNDLVLNALNSFRELYFKLYEISIDYDGGKIDGKTAKQDLAVYLMSVKNIYNNLKKIKGSNKINLILNSLNDSIKIAEGLNDISTTGLVFNSALKDAYFKVVFLNIALAKTL